MKSGSRLGLVLFGTAFTYGGWAAASWLRYGRHEPGRPVTSLDRFIPEPEVLERHETEVAAPAGVAYNAALDLDLRKSGIVQFIFDARAALMGEGGAKEPDAKTLIEQSKEMGWSILEEHPGHEIVLGTAAKPWLADPHFRSIPREEFAEFNEPGWAKIVWNFSVQPLSHERSIVRNETRVMTTDDAARRKFRNYWSLVAPGIVLIRKLGLRIVRREAEQEYSEEARLPMRRHA